MNAKNEVRTYRLDVRMHNAVIVQVVEANGDISKLNVEMTLITVLQNS